MQNFKLGRLQKYLEIMPDLSNSLRDLTIKHPVYQLVCLSNSYCINCKKSTDYTQWIATIYQGIAVKIYQFWPAVIHSFYDITPTEEYC